MKKFLLSMLVMAVRILNSAEILAQPKTTPVFEHVHALAMESAATSSPGTGASAEDAARHVGGHDPVRSIHDFTDLQVDGDAGKDVGILP